jgi:hypothetical protein
LTEYITFENANNIHSEAIILFKERVESLGGKCYDTGFEYTEEFKTSKPFNNGVSKEKRNHPDLKVILPNGYEFYVEVKSRGDTYKPDISVEIYSILEGIKYENSFIACIHLKLGYMNLVPCYNLMMPEAILIGRKWEKEKLECEKIFPKSKIITINKPNGRGNPYTWVTPEQEGSVTLEEFIKQNGGLK